MVALAFVSFPVFRQHKICYTRSTHSTLPIHIQMLLLCERVFLKIKKNFLVRKCLLSVNILGKKPLFNPWSPGLARSLKSIFLYSSTLSGLPLTGSNGENVTRNMAIENINRIIALKLRQDAGQMQEMQGGLLKKQYFDDLWPINHK